MRDLRKNEIFLELFVIVMGILGTAGCFLSSYPLDMSQPVFYLGLALTGGYFYYAYTSDHKKRLLQLFAILYLVLVAASFTLWRNGVLTILNVILRVYEGNSQFQFQHFTVNGTNHALSVLMAMWVIFIPVCLVIIRTIRCKHSYFLAFFVSVPFIFSILLFTLRPHTVYFIVLLMYYLMLFGMAFGGHYDTYSTASSILKCGVCFGLCGLLIMVGMRQLVNEKTYIRDKQVEKIRVMVQSKVRELIQGGDENGIGELDLATAGNRYYIHVNELKVDMAEPRDLYLHSFSASVYGDNKWTQPEEEKFRQLYNWKEDNLVHPFEFVRLNARNASLFIDPLEVKITNIQADPKYVYMPYHIDDELRYEIVQDAYLTSEERVEEATFHIWNDEQVAEMRPTLAMDAYLNNIRLLNLEVPEKLVPVLEQIKIEGLNDQMPQAEKTALIQSYIRAFGTYTLTPGVTPKEKDFIQYFLNEHQEGYCVHYASAAVMLLRYHGVPARFASGYHIYSSDFAQGTGYAQDADAHAWAEVLDPQEGWKVLEVTPSVADEESITDPNREQQTDPVNPEPNQTDNEPSGERTNPVQGQQGQNDKQVNQVSVDLSYLGYLIAICVLLALLPVRRWWMKRRWKRNMHCEDAQRAILYCGDYLAKWNLLDGHPENIQKILEEAKFSNHHMSELQKNQMLAYCEELRKTMRAQLTIRNWFVYHYIKCID